LHGQSLCPCKNFYISLFSALATANISPKLGRVGFVDTHADQTHNEHIWENLPANFSTNLAWCEQVMESEPGKSQGLVVKFGKLRRLGWYVKINYSGRYKIIARAELSFALSTARL
jgi:hypothetical protein